MALFAQPVRNIAAPTGFKLRRYVARLSRAFVAGASLLLVIYGVAIGSNRLLEILSSSGMPQSVATAMIAFSCVLLWLCSVRIWMRWLKPNVSMIPQRDNVFAWTLVTVEVCGLWAAIAIAMIQEIGIVRSPPIFPTAHAVAQILLSSIAIATLEEIQFRALIIETATTIGLPPWIAVIASSLCFVYVHHPDWANPVSVLWYLVPSLLWAVAYSRSQSLLPSIVGHAASNLTLWLALGNPQYPNRAFTNLSQMPEDIAVQAWFVLLACVFVLHATAKIGRGRRR